MKLVYQYIAIFFNFQTTSNHLHPLQVENCDSNSRLVVDEDDNDKLRLERVNMRFGSRLVVSNKSHANHIQRLGCYNGRYIQHKYSNIINIIKKIMIQI